MNADSFIRLLAGSMILLSVALVYLVSPWWLLFTAFIGANLFQSALTGFCPPTLVLRKLGWLDENNVIHWGGRH
jgi:hypothetical protein